VLPHQQKGIKRKKGHEKNGMATSQLLISPSHSPAGEEGKRKVFQSVPAPDRRTAPKRKKKPEPSLKGPLGAEEKKKKRKKKTIRQ